DTHGRREAHQQLPVVGHCLQRGLLFRRPVARLRRGRARPRIRVLRQAPAPLRPHRRADRGRSLLIKRFITALILGSAVTVALLFSPTPVAAAVLGLLFVAGAWEWAGLAQLSPAARAAYTAAFTVLLLASPWWVFNREVIAALLLVGLVWWLLALLAVLTYPRRLPLAPV